MLGTWCSTSETSVPEPSGSLNVLRLIDHGHSALRQERVEAKSPSSMQLRT